MAGGPFLLPEDEQEAENQRQLDAWANEQRAAIAQKRGIQAAPRVQPFATRQAVQPAGDAMYDNGMNLAQGGMNAAMAIGGQQAGHLAGMINQASNAWGNELDSRVAQSREMRRMQHEKDMERMRQEAVLKRLQMEQEMMREQMRQQRRASGIISSTDWMR